MSSVADTAGPHTTSFATPADTLRPHSHETREWVSATGHVLRLPPQRAESPLVQSEACVDVRESSGEMEEAGVFLGPVRAARMQRFGNAQLDARSSMPCATAPRAARHVPVVLMPRMAPSKAARAAPRRNIPAATPAPACVWTQFRMACGTVVYVHAGDITPALASAWTTGEAPWPVLCALSLDATPRTAGSLHGHMPGPELGGEAAAQVRAEIAAWAEKQAAEEAGRGESMEEPMEEESADEVAQLRRQLEAARARAMRLEHALLAAGVPVPL